MILKCPACQTQYKLGDDVLGIAGREVRCTSCSHTWFQLPEQVAMPQQPEVKPQVTGQSITEALDSILQQDDAAFGAILSNVAKEAGTAPVKPVAASPPSPPPIAPEKKISLPKETHLPVMTHNPLGVGENMFGVLVFALLMFMTLGILFTLKSPIMHHWPQTAALYKVFGFKAPAPGEGLQISEVTAERRIDSKGKLLVIEGRMTNMTESEMDYPALQVTVRNGMDMAMKSWDLKPGASKIASGDAVPVNLQLDDAPDDATSIEMHVKE